MDFTEDDFKKFQTLDEFEKEIFSPAEIEDIHARALLRSAARKNLSDDISCAVAQYMAENKIGFNELKKRLNMSATSVSKILRGDANLTLDTLSLISQTTGLKVHISFSK